VKLSDAAPQAPPALDLESIACILYTSGTTGRPKGVMLSHRAILATVLPTAERTGLTSADSLLSSLPLFWVAGLVIRALPTLTTGCTLILMRTFTVPGAIALLRRHHPTAVHLRPPQVGQLLAHPEFDPACLDRVRRGGGRVEWFSPLLDETRARLITGYGMTETAGYVVALRWDDPPDVRRTTLGLPLPGVELRIAGAKDEGDVGEILVRGPGLFSGYYKEPPETGLDAGGFFQTGDLGSMGADGFLRFVGRCKDLLRVKGINVSPLEVETVLQRHPGVEAIYAVGLPEGAEEQEVVALVIAKPGMQPSEEDLRSLAEVTLSYYKRPGCYLFVLRDEIPLGGTAKPQRRALAQLALERLADRRLPHRS
jgi:acyl-CoA synthetase (AMP-forming)/AMP-acid ligase II